MPDYFQLNDYKIWDTDTGNLGILISNSTKYYEIIRDAIYQYRFGPMWPDRWGRYEYGFHINEIGESEQAQVTELLDLFTRNICIIDALSQTFALDMHSTPNYELGGKIEKTEMGNLVYQSKPYGKSPSEKTRSAARKLADLFAEFISKHPSYSRSDIMIPVPFFGQKVFDLPTFLAQCICPVVNIEDGQKYVRKVKDTKSMKDAASEDEKFNIIRGAFEVINKRAVHSKRIIIIDDIYQSGHTLNELAYVIRDAGADVLGLVATKTLRTFNQDFQR